MGQRRRRKEARKRQCSGLGHCSRGQAHGLQSKRTGQVVRGFLIQTVPQAMGSGPLAQLLFYQYKCTEERSERLQGNGSTQSKAKR
jgi:hypothetical protein